MITIRGHGRSLARTVHRLFAQHPDIFTIFHGKVLLHQALTDVRARVFSPWVNPCSVIAGVLECNKLNNMKDINFITPAVYRQFPDVTPYIMLPLTITRSRYRGPALELSTNLHKVSHCLHLVERAYQRFHN